MRCWRWHERPWVSTLCAAFAAVVLSAAAGSMSRSLWGAHVLPEALSSHAPLSFIDMSIHHLRLERFGARAHPAALRGVTQSPACSPHRYLLNLAARVTGFQLALGLQRTQAQDSLVAHLLTL